MSDEARKTSKQFLKLQANIDQTIDKIRAKVLDKQDEANQLLSKYNMML